MYSDYKILYSPNVENKLDDFVDYMSQTCRYRDSGLYEEDLIVDNFINDIKLFNGRYIYKNLVYKTNYPN